MTTRGVTLIELLVVIFWLTIIVLASSKGYDEAGWIGLIVGLVAGGILPPLLLQSLAFLENFFWGGIPRFPQCRKGQCDEESYKFVHLANGQVASQCRCGDLYMKCGRRFLEIDEGGTSRQYLKWIPFKGWVLEEPE